MLGEFSGLTDEEVRAVSPPLRGMLRWSPDGGRTLYFYRRPEELERIKINYEEYLKQRIKWQEEN